MANTDRNYGPLCNHMYMYDLGWLVKTIMSFQEELDTAIDLKTIHYADPIQWDITTQYSPNTVVVDPKTGTAYMSKVPVPAGVQLDNTDYWVVIFNYQRIYDKIMSGVAFNDKENLEASKDISKYDFVWFGGDLYQAQRDISQGSKYVPGVNIVAATIADALATYYGRDRVAQVINDTLTASETQTIGAKNRVINVTGDQTVTAGDIAETSANRTIKATADYHIDVDGNLSDHVDGVTTVNRGGAVTEAYGSSLDVGVTGTYTAEYSGTVTEVYRGKRNITAKDMTLATSGAMTASANQFELTSAAKTFPVRFPDKIVDLYNIDNTLAVNVRDFGAVGNAHYYDINSNAFFTDDDKLSRPTSDVDAVKAAIEYALSHNIHTVYFPDGDYYLPQYSIILDTSKLSLVGSGHACLCREGSEQNSFITLTSPVDLAEYTYARVPLRNISLHGNSFTGSTDEGLNGMAGIEYGVKGNSDTTLISPHINLENVTVQGFSCGIRIGTAYKSTLININLITCNYGIYIMGTGLAPAVPLNIFNPHIEVCNHALYMEAARYNEVNIFGGAFEYCRQFVASNLDIAFYGTRFESDILAFMDVTTKTQIPGFNITGACLHMHNCYLLLIPNYAENVKFWQPNLSKLKSYTTAFFSIQSTAMPGLVMDDTELSTDQWVASGTYFISSGTKNMVLLNNHALGTLSSKNNIIDTAKILDTTNGFIK